ncbi:MAG: hypothetical protein R3Y19_01385 [Rikenellaceae bacterium]
MKTKFNYFLSLLLCLFFCSCSSLGSPEESVTTFLTTIQKAHSQQKPCDTKEILAMHCNERKSIELGSSDAESIMKSTSSSFSCGTFEILSTAFSDDGNAALVEVKMTRSDDETVVRTKEIFLSKVGSQWLIDLYTTNNQEYYQASKNLKKAAQEKAAAELASKPDEDFDAFIKKFTEDFKFQCTRIVFPVGYSVSVWEDGEEKTELNKKNWNQLKFSKDLLMHASSVKDDKGNMTYSWESDGGMAGGSATFSLNEKEWYMTNYSSFSY